MVSQVRLSVLAIVAIAVFGLLKVKGAEEGGGPLAPTGLKVEYLTEPMGVDTPNPRFFWVPEHEARGQAQTAYEIVVSTPGSAAEGDMWSTGKVSGAFPGQVAYAGKAASKRRHLQLEGPLLGLARPSQSLQRHSQVRLRALFARRLDGSVDRREEPAPEGVQHPEKVVRAKAFICGLGYSELRLNGRKVGPARPRSGLDDIRKSAPYMSPMM